MPDATSREPLKNSLEMLRRNRERLFRRLNAGEENATSASEPFLDPPLPRPLTLPRSGPRPYAIFVLGCGTGQVVDLVRESMSTQETETVIVVVEPDLARLRRSFQIHDWSNSMADPKVRFAAGEDLDLAIREALPEAIDPIRSIALGVAILPGEHSPRFMAIRERIQNLGAAADLAFQGAVAANAKTRKRAPGQPRLDAGPLRVGSVVDANSTALRHLATAIGRAAETAGHDPRIRISDQRRDPFVEADDARFVLETDPDMFLSFLRPGSMLCPWRADFPSLVLVSSSPRLIPIQTFPWSDRELVVVAGEHFAGPFRALGIEPLIRPLATELPDITALTKTVAAPCDVCIVGNLPTIHLAQPLPNAIEHRIGELADDWVAQPERHAEDLLEEAGLVPSAEFPLDLILAYEATRRRRVAAAIHLAEHGFNVRIHGDAQWRSLLAGTAAADCWHGWVDSGLQQSAAFRAAAVSLNVGSFAAPDMLNMRAFDIPSAGGVLISDDEPALHDAFDVGTEALAFQRIEELPALVSGILADPGRRASIATAGRARVERDHSWNVWWTWAEARLRERFG
ncbi:MAG: glycosyltransferase [Phycisphaerales bacterium]